MMASRFPEPDARAAWLADGELRLRLERFVKKKLQGEEANDVVQSTIADALASDGAPTDEEGFRRFVFGIARNKVVDHYRRNWRETADESTDEHPHSAHDAVSTRDLLRWAEEELPNSEDKHTLEWMLREADGDKLEHIAEEAKVPAPRVRQRVSRLRRYLRERWAAQLAAAGVAGVLAILGFAYYKSQTQKDPVIARENPEIEHGHRLRGDALEHCRASDFALCLEGLDRAKIIDPAGDARPEVQEARRAATEALKPKALEPVPSSVPAPEPSTPPVQSSNPIMPKTAPVPKPTAVPQKGAKFEQKTPPKFTNPKNSDPSSNSSFEFPQAPKK